MPNKKFTVAFHSGDLQTVYAATGDQDKDQSGYVFFLDENDMIVATLRKVSRD